MNSIFETSNLLIRSYELNKTDIDFVFRLLNTDGWIRNIGNRNIHTYDDAEAYISEKLLKPSNDAPGYFVIESKALSTSVGTVGILKRDYLDVSDFGYALLPEYYKKGFAFEAAQGILYHAKTSWQYREICAIVNQDNIDSKHLLAKCNLKFQKSIVEDQKVLDYYWKLL